MTKHHSEADSAKRSPLGRRSMARVSAKLCSSLFALVPPFRRLLGVSITRGYTLRKLGTSYGGWHVSPELLDEASVCYCVGAGEDISFDCELVRAYGCEVVIFDPTPRARHHVASVLSSEIDGLAERPYYDLTSEQKGRTTFLSYGIWSSSGPRRFFAPSDPTHVSHSILNLQGTSEYFDAECRSLSDVMDELGHQRVDLLKLDVEGAEYAVIDSLLEDDLDIRTLLIEFDEGHNPLDFFWLKRIRMAVGRLVEGGFVLVHVDHWNLTFVREARVRQRM